MKHHFFLLLSLIAGTLISHAEIDIDSVKVHFRVSHTEIDPEFRNNGTTLDSIFHKLATDSLLTGPTRKLKRVTVTGAASPEGSVEFNRHLSEKRAYAIFDVFRERASISDTLTHFNYLGRDWHGLRIAVEADGNVPHRQDVIDLLDRIGSPEPPAHPLEALKSLDGGEPYAYLHENLFPELRASRLVVEYERLYPQFAVPAMPLSVPGLNPDCGPGVLKEIPAPVKTCKPFYMGLKTNMLYDALLIPNIGAEFYIGRNWSLTADWMYGWWDRNSTHYYWRAYGGTLGVRRWFGPKAEAKPLTGHHIGLFAGVVTYDFELGHGGIMGGLPHGTLWDRCNFISGVEYGYSLPVARRLNIDFTLGIGYMAGKYLKYEPKDNFYVWQSTHKLRWFGPTKAEISLVWLIGCDNYNRMKGGDR